MNKTEIQAAQELIDSPATPENVDQEIVPFFPEEEISMNPPAPTRI